MFHLGDTEKKVCAFPGNVAQGEKRRWQAGCLLSNRPTSSQNLDVPTLEQLVETEFQERSHTELPVTQTSGAGRAISPGNVPRLGLA